MGTVTVARPLGMSAIEWESTVGALLRDHGARLGRRAAEDEERHGQKSGTDEKTVTTFKTATRFLFGAFFIAAGVNHFINPGFYTRMMPAYLPWHAELVAISGVAEVVLGAMLLVPRFQVVAGWGLIALLFAVFPANVNMTMHPELYPTISQTALWLRLPFQALLIAWAYWYTKRSQRSAVLNRRLS